MVNRHCLPWVAAWCALVMVSTLPAFSQEGSFPDGFVPARKTLPNSALDFTDDSNESCCADNTPVPLSDPNSRANEFASNNPRYSELSFSPNLVECEKMADFPLAAGNVSAPTQIDTAHNLPIKTNSINVSQKAMAQFFTDPKRNKTSDFHVSLQGGASLVHLADVSNYSVCMGRGGNVAMVANTDNGSVITYGGNDHIYLAGDNTNMLTRTGAGEDVIEVAQAHVTPGQAWKSYNLYKTALSGSVGTDTVVIQGTPPGTKWCHIGGYNIYGEYFFVVEFALPPSVTEGPRRQRMSIGSSVEYIVFKGRKYPVREFLTHGAPIQQFDGYQKAALPF